MAAKKKKAAKRKRAPRNRDAMPDAERMRVANLIRTQGRDAGVKDGEGVYRPNAGTGIVEAANG